MTGPAIACAPGMTGPGIFDGSLYVGDYYYYDPEVLSEVTCVTGDLYIQGMSQNSDLSMLSSLQAVAGALVVSYNSSLTSMGGLEQLSWVGRTLQVAYNDQLTSLTGLSNLAEVNAESSDQMNPYPLQIHDNINLPGCWTWQIEGQTGANCTEFVRLLQCVGLRRQPWRRQLRRAARGLRVRGRRERSGCALRPNRHLAGRDRGARRPERPELRGR